LNKVTSAKDKNSRKVKDMLTHLIQSLQVTLLKIRDRSSTLTLHFNIYVDRKSMSDEELWVNLHMYLASQDYSLPLQGKGKVAKAPFICRACHGIDHP